MASVDLIEGNLELLQLKELLTWNETFSFWNCQGRIQINM